jgi:hypothetical protein
MRLFSWPARALCAVAIVIVALTGCSAPGATVVAPPAETGAATSPATPAETNAAASPASPAETATPPAAVPTPAAEAVPASSGRRPDPTPSAAAARPAAASPPKASTPAPATNAPASVPAPAAEPPRAAPSAAPAPVFTEVTVPSGTTLSIELKTGHASDTSRVEETVRGVLRRPLLVDGREVAPAGAALTGSVTAADQAGKIKGRARLVLRFSSIVIDESDTNIATVAIAREAAATKKQDAAKIGIGAGAGAVIGAIAGGKKGAVVGGTVGAGAGTGVVLATRGDEVQLPAGTAVSTTLSQPLVVRVRMP